MSEDRIRVYEGALRIFCAIVSGRQASNQPIADSEEGLKILDTAIYAAAKMHQTIKEAPKTAK